MFYKFHKWKTKVKFLEVKPALLFKYRTYANETPQICRTMLQLYDERIEFIIMYYFNLIIAQTRSMKQNTILIFFFCLYLQNFVIKCNIVKKYFLAYISNKLWFKLYVSDCQKIEVPVYLVRSTFSHIQGESEFETNRQPIATKIRVDKEYVLVR